VCRGAFHWRADSKDSIHRSTARARLGSNCMQSLCGTRLCCGANGNQRALGQRANAYRFSNKHADTSTDTYPFANQHAGTSTDIYPFANQHADTSTDIYPFANQHADTPTDAHAIALCLRCQRVHGGA
jgi:hypothetical protein